jgi:AGCS family alanine or glycine:cation symporter
LSELGVAASITNFLAWINGYLWGWPMLILLVGTGFFLTFYLGGVQFRLLGHALYLALVKRKEEGAAEGDITHFQALMTALAATVGTGNIVGVATAIAAGGPGALFWMWITGLVGMATKYAEAVLAVQYRTKDSEGRMCGGPMYYLSRGANMPWLGALFAIFAALAAFGIGSMVQSNSVAEAVETTFQIRRAYTGLFIAFAAGLVILGGIRSIAKVTQYLVPSMILLYVSAALYVIFTNLPAVPHVFALVIQEAFKPSAAVGGFLGATIIQTMRQGVARGVFSNESGLGSAPIAAAAAQTKSPVTQALVSMTQTFIDTIVVCSMTGFVIIEMGVWDSGLDGASLTVEAFSVGLSGNLGGYVVSLALIFFAYSTILGWSYYGEKSIEYLFGEIVIMPYRVIFTISVFIGAILDLDLVWQLADTMNAAMAIPNLIGLILLAGVTRKLTREYIAAKKKGGLSGGAAGPQDLIS